MPERLLLPVLNHLLRQEPWAQAMLRPFAGRVARFNLAPLVLTLQVDAAGWVVSPEADIRPAVTVTAPLAAAISESVAGGQAALFKQVRVEGDAEFAEALSMLLRNLRWDAAEDLSRVFGDVLAQRMVSGARAARAEAARAARSLAEAMAAYLADEQPALVRRAPLARFVADVAAARDAQARLEQRLERLERALGGSA